jgi:4a-hydroxytetrahydrobiopterin dehydratase
VRVLNPKDGGTGIGPAPTPFFGVILSQPTCNGFSPLERIPSEGSGFGHPDYNLNMPLSDAEIAAAIPAGWKHSGKAIERTFKFPDFKAAMAFVNRIADAAEEANHHPDIAIHYNQVTLSLWSHDSGGVTKRDLKMAATINETAGNE